MTAWGTVRSFAPANSRRMSAGTGIRHSEFNPSSTELVHFYQIWLLPKRNGISPSYEQRQFSDAREAGHFPLGGVTNRDVMAP